MSSLHQDIRTLTRLPGGEGVRRILRIIAEEQRDYFTEDNLPTFEGGLREDLETVLEEVWTKEGVLRQEWLDTCSIPRVKI